MHRSGTSIVMRLLHLCGMYLGPEQDLLSPADYDNPEGYWENKHIGALNDDILAALNSTWDSPPRLTPGWSQTPEFELILHRAKSLFSQLEQHDVFGWKDPRNSITLEFWRRLFPDLKIIVCLRNPVEVAKSLSKRSDITLADYEHNLQLWQRYYETLHLHLPPKNVLFTHYDTYFYDPNAELRRLLEFIGLEVTDDVVNSAIEAIRPDLHRNQVPHHILHDVDTPPAPPSVLQHYDTLCMEAGPVYHRMMNDKPYQYQQLEANVRHLYDELAATEKQVTAQTAENKSLRTQLEKTRKALALAQEKHGTAVQELEAIRLSFQSFKAEADHLRDNMQRELEAARAALTARYQQQQKELIQNHKDRLQAVSATLNEKHALQEEYRRQRDLLQAEIDNMRNTRGWRALTRWWAFKQRVIPSPAARTWVREVAAGAVRTLRTEGPVTFVDRSIRWLRGERRYHRADTTPAAATTPAASHVTASNSLSFTDVLHERFPHIQALRTFYLAQPERRLNLVINNISAGNVFGGAATAMIFGALLANRWDCELRIVTRSGHPAARVFGDLLNANNIPFSKNVEFLYASVEDPNARIPVGEGDLFLTTSWWTTETVRQTIPSSRILYLLQEDERIFYSQDDEHVRCSRVFEDPELTFILNTELLYTHLVGEGFNSIKTNGMWFEPSWPEQLFFRNEADFAQKPRNFFFYARPLHLRNLYHLGIEAIHTAIQHGVLNPSEWNFHFVGSDIPQFQITPWSRVILHQNLAWREYANLVRGMDLGLSLMYSPHPSYPPIDLAASGAVVVTNRYKHKQDLRRYSDNIVCCDLDVESIIQALTDGIALVNNAELRLQNYKNSSLLRNWQTSFAPILDKLDSFGQTPEPR